MSVKITLMLLVAAVVATSVMAQGGIECNVNEIYNICGHLCEPSCANPNPNRLLCPRIQCTRATTGGCRCVNNFLRDSNGDCVALDACPAND